MDAFDADVLICAAGTSQPFGGRLRQLLEPDVVRVGSVLLIPEVLTKPLRESGRTSSAVASLLGVLGRLDLRPVDAPTAELATTLAATYRLKAVDAVHLATAVQAGADRFLTNNRKDFRRDVLEVDVTYPEDLSG